VSDYERNEMITKEKIALFGVVTERAKLDKKLSGNPDLLCREMLMYGYVIGQLHENDDLFKLSLSEAIRVIDTKSLKTCGEILTALVNEATK